MVLKLYNTRTRKKEEFRPLDASNVRVYVCGPTVYDYAHIGNARPIIVFDVLYRLLRHLYGPEHVTYARNITDVDDKINARAAEEGIPIRELTERTTKQFHEDVAALGCLPPDIEPRATDHIDDMKRMIETLVEKGCAYVEQDHVLFHVAAMKDYGQLARRSIEDMQAGARVEVAPYKRDPMDFVLWKPSNEGEPGWPSPCGIETPGRPGWHIECSAMSEKHLGETFDIHAGGIDIIFPHHENEVAQSRCAHDAEIMANFWLHNGMLKVEGQKMSKSLGNFLTINELLQTDDFGAKEWPGESLRLAMLMTHYRQPIDWTVALLEQAQKKIDRCRATIERWGTGNSVELPYSVRARLEDDLNLPAALAEIDRLNSIANGGYRSGADEPEAQVILTNSQAADQLKSALEFLGINVLADRKGLVTAEFERIVLDLINKRHAARAVKDWAEADRIRGNLAERGIALKDAKDPETGEIVTTWEIAR